MKYTLLDLTQAVLSSMDSDEINSINDTPESRQVVEIIKSVYDDIISRGDLVSNKIFFNLSPSGDPAKPVLMFKPTNIDRIHWLKYDNRKVTDTAPVWQELVYLTPEDFMDYVHSYNVGETDVASFDYATSGFIFTFTYKNNTAPRYYTSFDDQTFLFDAYDAGVDTTLQGVKTLGYGTKVTEFLRNDDFTPALQPQQFALLLNEAKSLAWAELKQVQHGKAEQAARRNWIHLQKTRQQAPDGKKFQNDGSSFQRLPDYSRRV